ncbi:hypothetical protein [Aeromonas veronii]|uniref:Uncharacterized protein n=1 Tax=Aeromonas veronii TaxID=654 RepID=A0AAW5MIV6_AERVE|nr:hypothetical protein [Aeromonas veronii]MCR4450737.1 hypothetical protein [Aeromonas veronii]
MFDTLTPYFTMLPFGTAMCIALIGLVLTFVILVQASNQKKRITTLQTFFASVTALVGGWGFLNVVTLLLNV